MRLKITRDQALAVFGENGERWEKAWGEYGPDAVEPRTCWRGMIRHCSPQPGDGYLIEQVEIRRGFDDRWNDDEDTEWSDVLDHLNGGIEVTDEDLAETFGPQWREIVALVRRTAVLTEEEVRSLCSAWSADYCSAYYAARVAARGASRVVARVAAKSAAWGAARGETWAATWGATWGLVVRDLIGQHGFTPAHYDTLTGPWRKVIGPLHPEDAEL